MSKYLSRHIYTIKTHNDSKKSKERPKIVAIVGPTASGKSDLAVHLAKKFSGEVISADSRQVYKDLNIGTGKITKKEMRGVPHHLLDVVSPRRQFTVAQFKELAEKAIADIHKRGKTALLCGGTGFYIQAVVDSITLPNVAPDTPLRKRLEKKSAKELSAMLKGLDPRRAKAINIANPRRLIRAIEIARELGKVPGQKKQDRYDVLQIGIAMDDLILREKIHDRLLARVRKGMIGEVRRLHEQGISWRCLDAFGLEYRYVAKFLKGEIPKGEMLSKLETAIWHYAKRQKTWFKKDMRIWWFTVDEVTKIETVVSDFLMSD
jgi:tRNA dimethylallyltransferase